MPKPKNALREPTPINPDARQLLAERAEQAAPGQALEFGSWLLGLRFSPIHSWAQISLAEAHATAERIATPEAQAQQYARWRKALSVPPEETYAYLFR